MRIRPFAEPDRAALVALWRRCVLTRPWNDPERDIDAKLATQADGLLVAECGGAVVGSVMVGYDGHRGWVNYLAVDPGRRRAGLGRALMAAACAWLRERGCAKLNLQVREGNESALGFYRALGFVDDRVLSLGLRLDGGGDQSAPGAGAGPGASSGGPIG